MADTIQLTERNSAFVEDVSRRTGKSPEKIMNAFIEAWDISGELDERVQLERWRTAIFGDQH